AYNSSPNLQNSSDGRNPTQDANKFANPIMYAISPDGKPNPTNPTVAENGPEMGVPVTTFNNPPTMIATSVPSPSPQPGCCTREFYFAIFALMVVITGAVMWGAVKYPLIGIILLAIGAALLLGVGFFMYNKIQRQIHQQ